MKHTKIIHLSLFKSLGLSLDKRIIHPAVSEQPNGRTRHIINNFSLNFNEQEKKTGKKRNMLRAGLVHTND